MRDLFLGPLLLAILVQTFRTPAAGVLGWTWLTLMTPQKLIWGFLSSMPLNLILALATLAMTLFTTDKRKIPANIVTGLWTLFLIVITWTSIFAITPSVSWETWNRVVKIMLLGLLVPVLITTPRRMHALIWVIVMSLGFFGVKGGIFTLLLGSGHVLGPPESQLNDNNNLALALCLTLPLMNYLRLQTGSHSVRVGLLLSMVITTFGIMGTFSRGGFIGLSVMAGYLWWKSSRRMSLAIGVIAVLVPAAYLMPPSWYERMGTLKDASSQTTFLTRWDAWTVNWNIAIHRPFTGGGFKASEVPNTYRTYSYGKSVYAGEMHERGTPAGFTGGHAAHSVYFEVLGDHGLIGFACYFTLLLATLNMLRRVRKSAKAIASTAWIAELATMIQVSFLAFFVSGVALSMAYYDLVFVFIGITLTLDVMVREADRQTAVDGSRIPATIKNGKWRAPALPVT
jgi:probable O-glycosylation ligase (exosortase A-associated)